MEGTGETEEEEETIETTTSYCSTSAVSYYADVDGDGAVDGIIFADLAIGDSGTWTQSSIYSYDYSYDAVESSSLKEYTISENTYTDNYFGEGYIITPVTGTTGEDRFYVMALENTTTSSYSTFYWYYAAETYEIDDYSTITSASFGSGKTNTTTMKELWNSSTYGEQNSRDMWGLDEVGASVGESDSVWFVPSYYEWVVFGAEIGLTSDNYSQLGLDSTILSSSLKSSNKVYIESAGHRN